MTFRTALVGAALVVQSLPAAAQEPDTTAIGRLRSQIEAITRELERLQLGRDVVAAAADSAMLGLGPAASKVYRAGGGVSIGGYGEIVYENPAATRQDGAATGRRDQLDALRAVFYVGYKFHDRLLFNSEIEIEHGSTGSAGSVSLEFAYLDFRWRPELGFRAGLLLAPVGFVNELHEPPTFLGTARPETERQIIPTTWRENGAGIFGEFGDFSYRAYVLGGFDALGAGPSNATGFSATGLRGGRQKGSKSLVEDVAGVARLEYATPAGLTVGVSAYAGNSGQGGTVPSDPGVEVAAATFIGETHAQWRAGGLDLRGLLAVATVDGAELINAARGLAGAASVGERLVGWYVQGGYDVLRHAATTHRLLPFVRYERLDTQDRVPPGFSADPANDRTFVTLGAVWQPIRQIAVKADYRVHRNAADTGADRWNLALGYLF